MDDKLISTAVDAITGYLTDHPLAADTVEGIHCYWIPWGNDEPEMMAVTEAALLYLENLGFVERTKAGNRDIWRKVPSGDSPAR